MSFTDVGKSCPSCEFLTSQMCLLTLLAKIIFSQKFQGFTVKTKIRLIFGTSNCVFHLITNFRHFIRFSNEIV